MSVKKLTGFSLVEMAIVLAILGIVFVGFSGTLGSFKHSANTEESQSNLEKVRQALYQYAVIQKHLPCPDKTSSGDGVEDRGVQVCDTSYGYVPFLDLGLNEDDVVDAWGNRFAYAVNTDTTNSSLICDVNSSASYFCNAFSGRAPNFSFSQTPPVQGIASNGNYTVCNDKASSCSSGTATNSIETSEGIAVLVAYNEDGATTLANCSGTSGATKENCDQDLFYHQKSRSNEESNYFDDIVLPLSGYEMKSLVLSPVLSWNSYTPPTGGNVPPDPTYEGFDLTGEGEYQYTPDAELDENGDVIENDVVIVNRNITTDMDFGEGNDYIAIGNNVTLGTDITTGIGEDTLYIVNELEGTVDMGEGNDVFVLGTSLNSTVNMGEGNDKVWIQKDIQSGSNLNLGDDEDVLYVGDVDYPGTGRIYGPIDGGNEGGPKDYDILVLENVASWDDLSSAEKGYIQNFELVIFSADAEGNRNYYEY